MIIKYLRFEKKQFNHRAIPDVLGHSGISLSLNNHNNLTV